MTTKKKTTSKRSRVASAAKRAGQQAARTYTAARPRVASAAKRAGQQAARTYTAARPRVAGAAKRAGQQAARTYTAARQAQADRRARQNQPVEVNAPLSFSVVEPASAMRAPSTPTQGFAPRPQTGAGFSPPAASPNFQVREDSYRTQPVGDPPTFQVREPSIDEAASRTAKLSPLQESDFRGDQTERTVIERSVDHEAGVEVVKTLTVRPVLPQKPRRNTPRHPFFGR